MKLCVCNHNSNARDPHASDLNAESHIPKAVERYALIRRLYCLRNSEFALLAGGFPIVSVQQFLPINDRVGEKGIDTPGTFA